MVKFAVVKTGGKQYLVKETDQITVDNLSLEDKATLELETLAIFDDKDLELGKPVLTKKVKATVIANLKGDKLRISKFKSKVRYRRTTGFRSRLTTIKIDKI